MWLFWLAPDADGAFKRALMYSTTKNLGSAGEYRVFHDTNSMFATLFFSCHMHLLPLSQKVEFISDKNPNPCAWPVKHLMGFTCTCIYL